MYKEEGGEILTFGSDAHIAKDVCADFRQAALMAKEVGFSYFATFSAHKPVFHKL